MAEKPTSAEGTGTVDELAHAVGLLRDAESAARRTRAAADRYARDRMREADLLVAKARRVLKAAEAKADAIVTAARSEARHVIDLDALVAVSEEELRRVIAPAASALGGQTPRLDRMLASAIANAVDHALHDTDAR